MRILVNDSHKKIDTTGLKGKVMRGLAVTGATLIMFSGCSNSNAIEQPENTTTTSTTSISNTKETTTFREEIKVDTTTFVEPESITKQKEVESQVSTNSYNELLNELKEELSKKGFASNVNNTLIETFNELYENYNNWQGLYKDLPTREDFIQDKLINSIQYINEFNIYEEDSPEVEKLVKTYGVPEVTTADNTISLVNSDPNISMIALHEIAHAEQNIEENPTTEKQNYYYNGVNLSKALREGEATFNMKFTESPSTEKTYSEFIENSKGVRAEYKKRTGEGYAKYMNLYENLNLFVGYKNLDSVKGENIPIQIEEAIARNYGNELATEVMENFAELIKLENSYNKNKEYEQAIKTQTVFLKCIEHDIDSLNSKNDVEKYINIYRGYKLNNLLQVIDSQENNITNEIFDIDRLDDKMISKILEYKAIPEFTQSKNLNKMAIKAILMASNEPYYDREGVYQDLYIPNNLYNAKYTYFEEYGVGNIVFESNNGEKLQISFNDEEVINIQEPAVDREEYER